MRIHKIILQTKLFNYLSKTNQNILIYETHLFLFVNVNNIVDISTTNRFWNSKRH